MLNKMKEEIKELLLGSTAYGVPNVVRSDRLFNKILWILFLVGSSCATCFYVHEGILNYFSYEIVTFIRSEFKQPSEFPTVAFCARTGGFFDSYDNISQIIVKEARFGYDESVLSDAENHFESFYSQQYGRLTTVLALTVVKT